MVIQFALPDAFGPSEWHSLLLARLERFCRALRDQISLNFRRNREGHGNNFTLDTAIELPIPLDGVNMQSLFGRNGENLDTFEHAAAQAGQFTDNDRISWLCSLKNSGYLPFAAED